MTLKEILFGLFFLTIPVTYVIVRIWQDWKMAVKARKQLKEQIYIANCRMASLIRTIQHEWCFTDVEAAIKELKQIKKWLNENTRTT